MALPTREWLAYVPGPCARVSPSGGGHTLRLALVLAFPTVGLEQLLHTDRTALAALPVYQALHWLSDSLLTLPLAAVAVWGGERLARALRLDTSTGWGVVGRACLIALLFALVLVPGAALHDLADSLTHIGASFSTPSHVVRSPQGSGFPAVVARFVAHALRDGFVGQAAGLPLMVLALVWGGPKQFPSCADTPTREEA